MLVAWSKTEMIVWDFSSSLNNTESINQSINQICIAHIHKSKFVSLGFNKVWPPLPLTLNKSKEKLKKTFNRVKKNVETSERATCEGSLSQDGQKCNRCQV